MRMSSLYVNLSAYHHWRKTLRRFRRCLIFTFFLRTIFFMYLCTGEFFFCNLFCINALFNVIWHFLCNFVLKLWANFSGSKFCLHFSFLFLQLYLLCKNIIILCEVIIIICEYMSMSIWWYPPIIQCIVL